MYKYIPETRMQASPGLISTFFPSFSFIQINGQHSRSRGTQCPSPPDEVSNPLNYEME